VQVAEGVARDEEFVAVEERVELDRLAMRFRRSRPTR
jgi:hypothetical protein